MNNLKGDYLILLAGTNPIPNYIASFGLAKDDAKIFILYSIKNSKGLIGTQFIAENMKEIIQNRMKNAQVILKECSKSQGRLINEAIDDVFKEIEKDKKYGGVIHLNYTGGTKSMAAHAYERMKGFERKNNGLFEFVYSYVDSEVGKLIVNGSTSIDISEIGKEANPDIEEILNFQGYKIVEFEKKECLKDIQCISNIKIAKKNEEEMTYAFKHILMKNFNFYCVRRTEKEKNNVCKMELFILKDEAVRICGDEARICLMADVKNREKLQGEVSDFYGKHGTELIKIMTTSNGLEDILEWVRG